MGLQHPLPMLPPSLSQGPQKTLPWAQVSLSDKVLADTTCNASCQQHAGQVCMPADVKQDSQCASPLRLPLPSSRTPLRCRSRPRVARYRIVQSGIDSCLIRQPV